MYGLFKFFRWNPRKYYDTDEGEKALIRAFLWKYIDELEKEQEAIRNAKG